MDHVADPYRELGVLRGATDAQVKAAHRRLAKRFHPDAPEGDTDRFLAIQEAYLLLSDPLRRREWDRLHGSGPVAAGEPGRARARSASAGPRARTPGAGGRGSAGGRPTGTGGGPGGPAASRAGSRGGTSSPGGDEGGGAGVHAEPPPAGAPWSASDRDPAARSTTWSAAGVPWWEDFSPRDKRHGGAGTGSAGPAAGGHGGSPRAPGGKSHGAGAHGTPAPGAAGTAAGGQRSTAARSPEDLDVYSRSSGAAWSMAARRYFRKGEAELPKGGAWTYRGTQVVTGAEARKVAAEQAAERRRAAEELLRSRAPAGGAPDREAFAHEAKPAGQPAPSMASSPRAAPPAASRPAGTSRAPATPASAPASPAPAAARPSAGGRSAVPPPGAEPRSFVARMRRALGLG